MAGRPKGTTRTQKSDLVARIQMAAQEQGIRQQDLAREAGIGVSTWARYVGLEIVPASGLFRDRINAMAKKYGVQV